MKLSQILKIIAALPVLIDAAKPVVKAVKGKKKGAAGRLPLRHLSPP